MKSEHLPEILPERQPKPGKSRAVQSIQSYVSTHKSAIGRLVAGEFEIRTLDEAEKLSTMLAANTPCPDKAAMGIWELLSNAIEHGNLEIDFETKTQLLHDGGIEQEISRRLELAPYRDRVARVIFRCAPDAVRIRVEDDGPGFDFRHYLDAAMPVERPNGRGIQIARRMCFDDIAYRGTGSIVEALIWL